MKELNPDTTWFTSDTHFSHKWVLETGMRSFTDVDEMDFRMIQTWNNAVKQNKPLCPETEHNGLNQNLCKYNSL